MRGMLQGTIPLRVGGPVLHSGNSTHALFVGRAQLLILCVKKIINVFLLVLEPVLIDTAKFATDSLASSF